MDDKKIPIEPTPALQLDYESRDSEAMRYVMRMFAAMFIIWQATSLLNYLIELGTYFWEQSDPTARKLLPGFVIAIKTPTAVVAAYLLINTGSILKLNPAGRRWVISASLILAGLSAFHAIAMAYHYAVQTNVFRYGPAYGLYYTMPYAVFFFTSPLAYLVVFSVFRSPAGRDTGAV